MNEQFVLLEDTRNQVGKHDLKHEYFGRKGIKVVRSKLPAGDYALLTNMQRLIDTKKGVSEAYQDLIQQHERFRREADFCKDNGLLLIILIEDKYVRSLDDVEHWKSTHKRKKNDNRKPPVSGKQLQKVMRTFAERHGVKWVFCTPENAGRAIVYLLTGKDYGA
ncbi:MAG: hypothetical protein IJ680_06715 [Paludibacteraceae bacterium]|nr:hypothetical protein [Paludibacteraceae bacterium]